MGVGGEKQNTFQESNQQHQSWVGEEEQNIFKMWLDPKGAGLYSVQTKGR